MAEFFVSGIPEMLATFEGLSQTFKQKIASAMHQEALRMMELAKARTPVKTGALRDSGRVSAPQIFDDRILVALSFGDAGVSYAVPVHERTYVNHPNGQAKFLESVLMEESQVVFDRIAKVIIP